MTKMAVRSQIQIDCGPELRQKLRIIAMSNGMSLREFVLKTIAEKHPELKPDVTRELEG